MVTQYLSVHDSFKAISSLREAFLENAGLKSNKKKVCPPLLAQH